MMDEYQRVVVALSEVLGIADRPISSLTEGEALVCMKAIGSIAGAILAGFPRDSLDMNLKGLSKMITFKVDSLQRDHGMTEQ